MPYHVIVGADGQPAAAGGVIGGPRAELDVADPPHAALRARHNVHAGQGVAAPVEFESKS
jgi:hypothetical protein